MGGYGLSHLGENEYLLDHIHFGMVEEMNPTRNPKHHRQHANGPEGLASLQHREWLVQIQQGQALKQ